MEGSHYIAFDRVSGYSKCFYVLLFTFRHFGTIEGASGEAERSRERRASETVEHDKRGAE